MDVAYIISVESPISQHVGLDGTIFNLILNKRLASNNSIVYLGNKIHGPNLFLQDYIYEIKDDKVRHIHKTILITNSPCTDFIPSEYLREGIFVVYYKLDEL